MKKNKINTLLLLLVLCGCQTLTNETRISSQMKFIEPNSKISLGEIEVKDKNDFTIDSYQVQNFIELIAAQTDYRIDLVNKSNIILNVNIKENTYMKSLEKENSIVANLTLLKNNNEVLYHGILIKSSNEPITSDNFLFSIVKKSYDLMVKTIKENEIDGDE